MNPPVPPMIAAANAIAVSSEELDQAIKLTAAAVEKTIEPLSARRAKVTFVEDDGSQTTYGFGNTPTTRAIFTLKAQFPETWIALFLRSQALAEAYQDPRAEPFRNDDDDCYQRMLAAAISIPLDAQGAFNLDDFFAAVSPAT